MKTDNAEEDVVRSRRRGYVMQVLTAVALSMNHLSMGMSVAFSGVFTEQVSSADADVTLSMSQISWICSISSFGNVVGFLVSSYVNPMLGAIRLCQLSAPLLVTGHVVVAFGSNFWMLLLGRLLQGVILGVTGGVTDTHVGEVSSPKLRGFLTATMLTIMTFGITLTYLSGWLLGWRNTSLVMGITPMVFMFVVTLMLPRSPRWLITKGQPVEEAKRSLRFYFGQDYDVDKEVKEIKESLGDDHKHDASFFQVIGRLRHRHNLIPFLLILALYFFMVFSGGFPTTTFAPVIFRDVGGFSNPYMGSILVGVARCIAAIICSIIMNKLHRRTLLVVNATMGGIGCLATGCFFYYQEQLGEYAWVSLISIISIVFFMSLGIATLKNVLFSELLPNSIRSQFGGLCLTWFGTTNFIMVYTFPLAVQAVGMHGVYWFFTLVHMLMFGFSMFCLPDTNGKSIEEIQKLFVTSVTNTAADPIHVRVVNNENGKLNVINLEANGHHESAVKTGGNEKGTLAAVNLEANGLHENAKQTSDIEKGKLNVINLKANGAHESAVKTNSNENGTLAAVNLKANNGLCKCAKKTSEMLCDRL